MACRADCISWDRQWPAKPDGAALGSCPLPDFWVRLRLKDLKRGHQGRKGSPEIHANSWTRSSFLPASQSTPTACETYSRLPINRVQGLQHQPVCSRQPEGSGPGNKGHQTGTGGQAGRGPLRVPLRPGPHTGPQGLETPMPQPRAWGIFRHVSLEQLPTKAPLCFGRQEQVVHLPSASRLRAPSRHANTRP